jgi:hypothetical protein
LRPRWKSAALGPDPRLAIPEAVRLNKAVSSWLASQADGAPRITPRARLGPATVSGIVTRYKASEDYRVLRSRSRVAYDYEFKLLEQEFGHEIAATLSFSRVDDWLEIRRRYSPSMASHVLAKGRLLYTWAQRKELIPAGVNPFKEQRRARHKKSLHSQGGRRTALFSWEEIKVIVERADRDGVPSIGTALVIAFACVQRITDVITLTGKHIAGGRLRFEQSKTGFDVDMRLPAIVAERLAAKPPVPHPSGALIVSERTKRPYNEKVLAAAFQRLRDELVDEGHGGLAGKQLRDGRRSGFVRFILDGAGVEFTASISGHSIQAGMQIIETYLPKTPEQADKAVNLLSVKWA